MLKSLTRRLACPQCKDQGRLRAHSFAEGTDGHIQHGALQCRECDAWYPIDDNLLELVPASLIDAEGLDAFCRRWRVQLKAANLDRFDVHTDKQALAAQIKQREHFDWYADNGDQSYLDYAQTPFWEAADDVTFRRWGQQLEPGSWLLDIGCANGRSTFRVPDLELTIVGFDISKKMVRQAIEQAKLRGRHATTTFLVGDGDCLPFADSSFDYAMTYGVLHHLPEPGATCRRIQEILRPGGIFFASENNKTVFRGLFDLMMKVLPLWTEEAGSEPLISRQMIHQWHADLPVSMHTQTSVFLPPHLFNVVGKRMARWLLSATDRVASWVPGLWNQGGLILLEAQKSLDAADTRSDSQPAIAGKIHATQAGEQKRRAA